MGGYGVAVRYVQFAEDRVRMCIALPVALEGGGIEKCRRTDLRLLLRTWILIFLISTREYKNHQACTRHKGRVVSKCFQKYFPFGTTSARLAPYVFTQSKRTSIVLYSRY